jgi:predicted ATP-grasp superfamily ATP-dependent carboligase
LAGTDNPQPADSHRAGIRMTSHDPHACALVVAGASARAMAASAARAGWLVHAADLFADLDLDSVAAAAVRVRPYPDALPAVVARFPPGPWLYCGAVENHPQVIEAISHDRPLAGCAPAVVTAVRDPAVLAAAVRTAGLGFPETRPDPAGVPQDGSWLTKPVRSAGGHGISAWRADDSQPDQTSDRVWQRRVDGCSWSASYLVGAGRGRLIGVSRQLLGRRWCHARPFAFCGCVDIAPESLAAEIHDQLLRLGGVLVDPFGLVGLVGVDLVIDNQRRVHVIEVNPRPTASMELIERATGLSLAAAHLEASGFRSPVVGPAWPRLGTWSKAVLFAPHDIEIDDAVLASLRAAAGAPSAGWPLVADLPRASQTISAGSPICTLFAHGDSPRRSLAALRRRMRGLSQPSAVPPGADRHGTA